jgi:hypothetical protein
MKIWPKNVMRFQKRTFLRGTKMTTGKQNILSNRRNNCVVRFVYTSAAESRAATGQPENFKKNPAVAAAGPVTRILSGR